MLIAKNYHLLPKPPIPGPIEPIDVLPFPCRLLLYFGELVSTGVVFLAPLGNPPIIIELPYPFDFLIISIIKPIMITLNNETINIVIPGLLSGQIPTYSC